MVTETVVSGRKRLKRRTPIEEMAFLAEISEEEVRKILEILGVSAEEVERSLVGERLGLLVRVRQVARVFRANRMTLAEFFAFMECENRAINPDYDPAPDINNLLSLLNLGRDEIGGWFTADLEHFCLRERASVFSRNGSRRVVCPECYEVVTVHGGSAEMCQCGTQIVPIVRGLYWKPSREVGRSR